MFYFQFKAYYTERIISMDGQVLVLNQNWMPIKVVNVEEAISNLYSNKVSALDHQYRMHTWESWVDNWKDAKLAAQHMIRSSRMSVVKPRVIVLKHYKGFVVRRAKLSRRNLYLRDDKTCQYCGVHGTLSDMNIEHVVPKSRGGQTKWNNVVLACVPCNQRKDNRTPEEAKMKLIRKPFEPKWHDLQGEEIRKTYSNWHELLSDMYWHVELKD